MEAAISEIDSEVVPYDSGQPVIPQDLPRGLGGLTETETPAHQWLFFAVAILISIGFFCVCWTYWVPANSGVDQNGYLFGGRQLAETGTMKFAPVDPATGKFDPHQFVGRMWVGADYTLPTERFYPKYPIGLPLLVAITLKIGGPVWGPWLTYWINPFAMTAAVFATFLLLRPFCGSYLAVLGQLIFATSPVTMLLAIDINSHATAVCCVTCGMVGLFAWWRRGSPGVAIASGLLIGYAATIRYSEATLCLPIGLVILYRLGKFWRAPRRDWLGAGLLTLGWLIPVVGLLIYNLVAMRTPTGYDPTNESKPGQAFTLDHFYDNWETMLRHLATYGLFFVFPIGVVGLAWMFAWRRRVALVMAAWILPCMACYTFYYWAPDGTNIGYLRFFLTIFPALVLCAMWAIGDLGYLVSLKTQSRFTRGVAMTIAPLIAIIATAVHLQNDTRDLETIQYSRLMLKINADQVLDVVPANSVIFAPDYQLFHHLQFMRDYTLYDANTFRANYISTLTKNIDPNDPQGLDPGRSESLHERLKDFDQKALDEQQVQLVAASLAAGKRVFVIEGPVGGRRRDQVPRPLPDLLRRITKSTGADAMFADVISRWRIIVAPASVTEHDDVPKQAVPGKPDKIRKNQPRQQKSTVKTVTYEQPWLIYEVTKQPLPPSPEKLAMLDYEAATKAKTDQVAAEKAAVEKARQAADKKRQDDLQARRDKDKADQLAMRQKEEAAQQAAAAKLAAAEAKLNQTLTTRNEADRALSDLTAKQKTAQDALAHAAADKTAIEQSIASMKDQQQKLSAATEAEKKQSADLAASIEAQKKQLADLLQQIEAAKKEMARPHPTSNPTSQPSSGQ